MLGYKTCLKFIKIKSNKGSFIHNGMKLEIKCRRKILKYVEIKYHSIKQQMGQKNQKKLENIL